jgi:hypothetical protein
VQLGYWQWWMKLCSMENNGYVMGWHENDGGVADFMLKGSYV